MCQQLKAAKGEDFSVTCPPHPSLSDHPIDAAITSALADAGVLDYAGPQFYDWDGFSPSVIFDLVGQWVAHFGGDESKVAVCFGANYNPGFYTSLTPEVVASTWASIKAAYPGIHRAFGWSAQTDMDAGGSFGRTMRPRL